MPFDLLHIDVWDTFSTSTVEGYIHFLTIVDEVLPGFVLFAPKGGLICLS